MSRATPATCRSRCRAVATTSPPTSAPRPSSNDDLPLWDESCEEQAQLKQEVHRDRHQRLIERVGCGCEDRAGNEDEEHHVAPLLREEGPLHDPDPNQGVDDHRDFEYEADAED